MRNTIRNFSDSFGQNGPIRGPDNDRVFNRRNLAPVDICVLPSLLPAPRAHGFRDSFAFDSPIERTLARRAYELLEELISILAPVFSHCLPLPNMLGS